MVVHVTSKNEEDQIENEATTLNMDFSNTKGQLTPQSVLRPGPSYGCPCYLKG